MVVGPTMGRCTRVNLCCIFFNQEELQQRKTLGILSFDAAKTMCRLLSLYNSLTDVEIQRLRRRIIKSKGVAYLNSKEECLLINLAFAERLEDLNLAAATVSHLSRNCTDFCLNHFDTIYNNIKLGMVDIHKLEFGTRNIEKVIEKMEKLVSSTRNLHVSLESLMEMEALEKKMQRWGTMRSSHGMKVKVECFNDRIAFFRKQVQYYKQISLWNQTFDDVVGLSARIICIVYARICSVYKTLVTGMNNNNNNFKGFLRPNLKNCSYLLEHGELSKTKNICLFEQSEEPKKHILKSNRTGVIKFPNNRPLPPRVACGGDDDAVKSNMIMNLAPPSSVGGVGLSMRYANVIMFIERFMHAAMGIGEDARALLYDMLPGRLKVKVRGKLRTQWMEWEGNLAGGKEEGRSEEAKRWQMTVEEVMEWLLPMAHDTVRWQSEKTLEKQKFDTKLTVLLLQTLHYSDLEKVEEAIAEVLVGLSFICWCQKQW